MRRWRGKFQETTNYSDQRSQEPGISIVQVLSPGEPQSDVRFRLKLVPIVVAALLGFGLPYLAAYSAYISSRYLHAPSPGGPTLPWLYSHHAFQLLLALIAIAVVKHFVPADYGLHWPRGKTYIAQPFFWGAFFGVLMTVVDYAPYLFAGTKPDPGFPLSPANVWGWLFFEGCLRRPNGGDPVPRFGGHLCCGHHARQICAFAASR